MKEQSLLHRILYRCSTGTSRLFRMNVGLAWIGTITTVTHPTTVTLHKGDVLIRNARPFKSGIKGMSDLVGFHTVTVTPEMVGSEIAIYAAIEVKGKGGRVTDPQKDYINMVLAAGGIAGVARSEDDAEKLLT